MKSVFHFIFIILILSANFSCAKDDHGKTPGLDPSIPAGMVGKYVGTCYSEEHNYGIIRDTILNSALQVVSATPLTDYYYKLTTTSDCFPATEFLIYNDDFMTDSIYTKFHVMFGKENGVIEFTWIRAEKKWILHLLKWPFIGPGLTYVDAVYTKV